MRARELAEKAKEIAMHRKSLYVLGCYGAPMTASNKERYCNNLPYNKKPDRTAKIRAASADTFGFDCVCLIKAILWGWTGNAAHEYGGAAYESNGVPDINADRMIGVCGDVSADFEDIRVGEVVWRSGHIGIYIGDGLAVECTHRWNDGVQITAVHNIGAKSGYNGRVWTKHGKLPYVTYDTETEGECTVNLKVLKKGAKGDAVKAMQMLLLGYGFSMAGYGPDGSFGGATEKALKAFQKSRGLEPDGSCGPKTWAKLLGVSSAGDLQ